MTKKIMKNKSVLAPILLLSVVGTSVPMNMFAMQVDALATQEKSINSTISMKCDQATVKYSKFLENGGGEQWVKLTLEGANFNTKDPYKIKNAISQNYAIKTSLAVCNDGKSIEFGVFSPDDDIEYLEDWEITIDSSVLTSDKDATIKIPVEHDLDTYKTPKVIVSKKSVTLDELRNGFTVTLTGTNGALFNTACSGGYIRQSIIKTSNYTVYPLAYCNGLQAREVKLFIMGLNGVPEHLTELEFRIEGTATNSKVPLIVRIPIER